MTPFTNIPRERIIHEGALFVIIADKYPVSPGHLLIVSRKERKDFFDLDCNEVSDLPFYIGFAKQIIEKSHKPDGYKHRDELWRSRWPNRSSFSLSCNSKVQGRYG